MASDLHEDSKQKPSRTGPSEILLIAVVGVPLLGVLMGGLYSLPAMKLTKERDPWLTLLLAAGLGLTVFGIGSLANAPIAHLAGAYALSLVLLLLARKFYGGLGHSLERFGVVHVAALGLTCAVAAAARLRIH